MTSFNPIPAETPRRLKWQHIYFVLAAATIILIVGGLYASHLLAHSFSRSIEINQW